jgi:hypothetical protein
MRSNMAHRYLHAAYRFARLCGVDPLTPLGTVKHLGAFISDFRAFRSLSKKAETRFPFGLPWPCLGEAGDESGSASGHYFHQDLLVARRVFERKPARHLDVGSRIDGFVAHVASFRPIEVLDIRDLPVRIPNVTFRKADLMNLPPDHAPVSDSVSCLHALEHFGLGRYGDPLDPDGHLKGLAGLYRLLEPEGILYLSVPIGPDRIEYNAHRVFSLPYLLGHLRDKFRLIAFSYVDDKGDLHETMDLTDELIATSVGCQYGCGIFELRRL